jgi:glycosyltransferase involved in cell wall biosynthesis
MRALEDHGHMAELVRLPFKWYPADVIPDQMLAMRLFDLSTFHGHDIDRLICLKFPVYLLQHDNKVAWILHQHRDAYDMWDAGVGALNHHHRGREIRDLIRHADRRCITQECRATYANSRNVARRLQHYNDLDVPHLYHPPHRADEFRCSGNQPFLLFPSRLSEIKRQHLAIEAMAHVRSPGLLVLVGEPDNAAYEERLKSMVEKHALGDRVQFRGFVDDREKLELYADCRAVVFPPLDEDYGYVTLEAMLSSKAVITCPDSGGVMEFVEHDRSGLVTEPEPEALGEAFERMLAEPRTAARMGEEGREIYASSDITWQHVAETLTS